MSGQLWEVVGGTDKGGIIVREGKDLQSPQTADRLSTGALIKELALEGDRVHYERLTGSGPARGWVSCKLKGKDLIIRTDKAPPAEKPASAPVLAPAAELSAAVDEPPLLPPPPRGVFTPESTGRAKAGAEWEPALCSIRPKLRAVTPFDTQLSAKPMPEFDKNMRELSESGEGAVGHFYGLRFPYTLELIQRYGKSFLTQAFRASGILMRSNSVTSMEVEQFVAGSMSLKCFLRVEYAEPQEGLHSDLFVKYPFAAVTEHDRRAVYIQRFLMNNDGPEMDFARILSAGAPMKCPKYYFGDICLKTGTAILITEKLPLPSQSDNFGPFELEAIPYKSVDYLLDKPFDYYDSMTRNIAQLCAWGKCGKLGKDIENVFPPPSHPPAYFMSTKKRTDNYLECLYTQATCLLPEEVLGAKGSVREDEWFVRTLREVMPEVERAQMAILNHLFADADYCGFTHQNMNTDNAMFWRDEVGNVQSGFIDWGRFKRDNIARGLSNGYMCCDLCELVQASDEQWIKNYIESFTASGGPTLNFDVFWEHYMLSWLLQGLAAVDLPRQLILTGSPHVTPDGWKTISDYRDPRIFRLPNYNNGMVAIIRNFAYYWKCKDLPSFWQRWKAKHLDSTMKLKAVRR